MAAVATIAADNVIVVVITAIVYLHHFFLMLLLSLSLSLFGPLQSIVLLILLRVSKAFSFFIHKTSID